MSATGHLDHTLVLKMIYLDEVQGLVNRGLGVKGEARIDLGGDLAGDNLKNLLAELDEQTVEGGVDLFIEGAAL